VHLLVTPDEAGGVSRLMHTFARNYAGLFNRRHGRTGTLWEERYKRERGQVHLPGKKGSENIPFEMRCCLRMP
jgi:hypothetical protein